MNNKTFYTLNTLIFIFAVFMIIYLSIFSGNHINYFKNNNFFGTSVSIDADGEYFIEVIREPVNKVHIFKGTTLVKVFIASLGQPGSETPSGEFTIVNRGELFFSEKYKEGGYYWIRFKDDYLFHSVPFDEDKNFIDEEILKLGTPASHGCIRLTLDDIKWMYDNIPDGTKLIIE